MNLTHKLWLTTGMYSHRVYEFPVIHELNPGSNGWETVPCNLTSDKRDTQTDKTMSHHLVPSYMLFTVISRFAAFSSVSSILLQFLTFSEYMYLLFQRFEPNRTNSDLNYKDAKVLRQCLPSNITCMHWCLWVSENGRMTYWKQLWSSSHTTVCILFPNHINQTSLYQWLSFCVEVLETLLQEKGEFVSYFLFSSLPFVQCLTPCMSLWGIWQRWLYWHCSFSQSSDLSLFKKMILEHWGNTLSMFFLNCNQSDQHILGNPAIYNCMKMGCCKWCQGVYRFMQLVSDIHEKWIDLSNVQLYHSKICRHSCIGVLRVCKPHYAW